ncbi:MAG: 16S rRNA (uracil(1498)-N(3))-methyltransferase [Bacilli bacterium]|nr:16S rRNA (uracil(1498)-N(3))-methyltransferase [Bacilli bacterium]MBN2696935.1 16S rRNA (uracil(1498)-N(3))-methyltransferase [Bacilli bacterium]
MQRYFVPKDSIRDKTCTIINQDVHHIRDVMRYRPGQRVIISVIDSLTYEALITSVASDKVVLTLEGTTLVNTPNYNLTIAQALIRKDRFEILLEKASEFGATAIIPTVFARSIVKIEETKAERKLERYQAIVKEAAEQAQRSILPKVMPFQTVASIDYSAYDKIIVCYEQEALTNHLNLVIPKLKMTDNILIVVGPEGGISPEERQFLFDKGAIFVSLGARIYRSESAALMVLAAFTYTWGI